MNRSIIIRMINCVLIYYVLSVILSFLAIIFNYELKYFFAYNVLLANIVFIILAILKEHYYD
jgi:hypothetical protein